MIYFIIEEGCGKFIKIGYAGNVDRRITQLQTGNPRRLRIAHTLNGGYDDETRLHHKFSAYRRRGEWFVNGGRLSRFMLRKIGLTKNNALNRVVLGHSWVYRLGRVFTLLFRPRYFRSHSFLATVKWLFVGPQ